ncbi:hypothetical protein V1512DRAFT_204290 [Lipomyces arxii]|uniref:uncharacterized protein n=1 Tax=Lipomyces arxii TaxID=56418 RepID=UPI0034CD7193
MTKGRRVKPILQLKLVGGSAKGLYEVDVMQCRNMGSGDGGPEDVQWKCTADVPGYFKLGRTDVICEGYNNPDDPYILRGSCGVEYTLQLTEAGKAKYNRGGKSYYDEHDPGSGLLTMIMFVVIVVGLAYGLSHLCAETPVTTTRGPRRSPWFGNFFGGGDGNDGGPPPPPPYSPYDGRGGGGGKQFSAAQQSQYEQWRPGFWSGLGAGAAASALYNSYANRSSSTAERARMINDSYLYNDFGGANRRSSWGSSSSSSRVQEDRQPRTSSGFGGTSRR